MTGLAQARLLLFGDIDRSGLCFVHKLENLAGLERSQLFVDFALSHLKIFDDIHGNTPGRSPAWTRGILARIRGGAGRYRVGRPGRLERGVQAKTSSRLPSISFDVRITAAPASASRLDCFKLS